MTQILVIEDDNTVCTLLLKLLQAEAFDVLIAHDGRTGIQLAQAYEPDLIICDIMMPECDGYEVLRTLRARSATAIIPFIFLSAKGDRSDLRQGMELGADDYLIKPFKRAELLGAIAARLAKRTALTQPYINEMKRAANTLGQMAYVDPLTNLPNRIAFHAQCQQAIKQAQETQQLVAVLQLNLRDFGAINATWGYFNGDRLLQKVAERLKLEVAETYPVARLVASNFSVLISVRDETAIADVAAHFLAVLAEPYTLDERTVSVQIKAGIAFYPNHGTSPEQLFKHAEIALRSSEAQDTHSVHNNQYQFYTLEMGARAADQRQRQQQLEQAIEQQELHVYYQPQVNLITGRIIGAEAFLRWQHPEHGLIDPNLATMIAEVPATAIAINQWLLETACTQATQWQAATQLPIRLIVNLSAHQFAQETLVASVAQILQQTTLAPEALVLELTETCAMENVESAILKLQALNAIGVQIAIDGFGTGYSSLNYLKRFPLDTLKIDPSFIQKITADTNDAAIVRAMIAIGQSLQLKVIAEGVKTIAQFNFLRQSGCYAMQGALFSDPLSIEALQALLLADKRFDSSTARKEAGSESVEIV